MRRRVAVASLQYRIFGRFVSLMPLRLRVSLVYLLKLRRLPALSNPQTFNEKIQWRKVNDRNPLFAVAADKLASKEFVRRRCPNIVVPKVYWAGKDVENIDWDVLPNSYVVKANHGSKMNIFVRDGQHPERDFLRKAFKAWLEHDQASVLGEVAYGKFERCCFIEEFLDFAGESVPTDYKFFVYGGMVKYVQVDQGRFANHKRNMMTKHWVDLGFRYSHPRQVPPPARPKNYQEMVEAAEELGRGFDFIRVDLYSDNERVYFGELTVYPGAGYERFECRAQDLLFGSPWALPSAVDQVTK